jgi:hypothetical protein
MTDNMTSQNIVLSSWDILYARGHGVLLACTVYSVLYSEIALHRKPFGIGHMYIYTLCLLRMTGTMTSQNIVLSSWGILYARGHDVLLACTVYSVLYSETAISRKPFGLGHMYIYTLCLLRMTGTMTSLNTDRSSWDILYARGHGVLLVCRVK